MAREDAQIAHASGDAEVVALPHEEALEAFARDLLGDAVGVDSRTRLLDCRLAHIGSKHLNARGCESIAQRFDQRDRDGVDLLTAGAAGYPDADRHLRRTALGQTRKDALCQQVKGARIAKEPGDADQEVLIQRGRLGRIAANQGDIVAQVLGLLQRHAACEAAAQGAALVVRKIHTMGRAQPPEYLSQVSFISGGLRVYRRVGVSIGSGNRTQVRVTTQTSQLARDLVGPQHEINAPGGDGAAGHARKACGGRLLGEGDASGLLDGLDAQRPVAIPARENHADGAIATFFGERGEQNVRGVMHSARTRRHANAVTRHRERGVGRYHVDMVGLRRHTVVRLHHRKSRSLGQNLGQQALVARIEMLNDNTGHTALGRQSGEQFGNRLEAARRGSHGYDRSCHMALLGATHPALDGTTTVVVGHQYRPSRASKRSFGLRCPTDQGVRLGRSGSPTRRHRWRPRANISCQFSWLSERKVAFSPVDRPVSQRDAGPMRSCA